MWKHKGEVGELAALLVDKWKRNVIKEQQRRIAIAQKKFPDELSEAHVEIITTVTAYKYGSSGYETLGKLGLAIINREEADWTSSSSSDPSRAFSQQLHEHYGRR